MDDPKQTSIYLIDDDATVLKAISQSLQSSGYRVSSFRSAEECLVILQSSECNLIISDVNMPNIDGISLLKKIKELKPSLPVLIITGFASVPLAVEAIKLGAYDFIEKPFDETTLLNAVKKGLATVTAISDYKLTAAELKILQYVASGKSNKEIAYLIDRSIRTVENQRHRLMRKLKVNNGAGLTKIAISLGLS